MNRNKLLFAAILTIFFVHSLVFGQQDTTLTVTSDGNVGIGTTHPLARLQVNAPEGNNGLWIRAGDAADDVLFHVEDSDGTVQAMHIDHGGRIGIGTTSPSHPLEMASGAYVSAGGVWTNASSAEFKENIRDLSEEEAIAVLSRLSAKKFNYRVEKGEQYLGFIAEEVPALVATKDRKGLSPMDIIAVLTKVVQQQQRKIEELEARLGSRQ